MRRRTQALAVTAAVLAGGGVAVISSADEPATQTPPVTTAPVARGALSAAVSLTGTLTYRAQADGSPYVAINQARGIYTKLPAVGDKVGCGDVLYRVDDRPVLLLCGTLPAYRDLEPGDHGKDVRQLNRTLRGRGDSVFSAKTEQALKRLQHATGAAATGTLDLGAAVFVPKPARIAKLTAALGRPAVPGAEVARLTSDTLEVQVDLEPSQQAAVHVGDRATITLPDLKSVSGKLARLGRVAEAGKDGDVTILGSIALDRPGAARGLDRAPVQVEIATAGVEDALSVPVTALVGKAGGGFAVERVGAGGRRELVAVTLGLFDTAGGRVQVEGALDAGDRVVVPSS